MPRDHRTRGLTMIELVVVLALVVVSLAVVSLGFNEFQQRSSSRRAGQLFARDLALARSSAMRGRQAVSVVFDEGSRSYVVRRITGESIVRRGFSSGEDIVLSGIDLQMPGDSLVFDSRGIVDLSEISDPLGRAVFQSGTRSYDVWFNSMGATRLDSS